MQEHAREDVVTVCEHIGLHPDALADDALDGKAPAVDLRPDALDDDTPTPVDERCELPLTCARRRLAHSLTRASGHALTLASDDRCQTPSVVGGGASGV
jgi:hypothetical protein